MERRDNFRRQTVAELEKLSTSRLRTLDPPLDYLAEELKLEEPPYRYSLIRDTRKPPAVPTRVIYREFDGKKWSVVPIYSISFLIDPMERAALEANAGGNRVNALLLIHALLEILMRSDPLATYGHDDRFVDVAKQFKRRLVDRDLPGVDPSGLYAGIRQVNEKRNDVIHGMLVRYGLEPTNARLTPAEFEGWKRTYDDTLGAVFEYLSL